MRSVLASPLVAAVLGGGVTAAALIGAGAVGGGTTTTVIQPQSLGGDLVRARDAGSMTARDIYRRDAPGVVFITARSVQPTVSPFELFPRQEENTATGSGFVIDPQGHVLTNAHVVQGATDVRVKFSDDRVVPAKVVGKDIDTDLAVVKVSTVGLRLRPLALGDSDQVQVGDPTVAIGNPFGLERTLTTGVVSALQREIKADNGFTIHDVIQTDAAINPGNSGGPLLDAAGRVIGINSQIATASGGGGSVGIGFAVPINTAKWVIPQLKDEGRVRRPYLGIDGRGIDPALAGLRLGTRSGVLVERADPGTPAYRAGLRGGDTSGALNGEIVVLGGDIILRFDGKLVKTMDDVIRRLADHKPGDRVKLDVLRNRKPRTLEVELGERPNVAGRE